MAGKRLDQIEKTIAEEIEYWQFKSGYREEIK